MASRKVDTAGMAGLIQSYLNNYGLEVKDALQKASATTGKKVAKDLRKGGSYNTNEVGRKFNSGWVATEEKTRIGISTVVHNTTVPGLAHLLEFGHAKRNGGRSKAFNFIAPIADKVDELFATAFEKELNK